MTNMNLFDIPPILSIISKVSRLKALNLFDSFMILNTPSPRELYVESPAFVDAWGIKNPGVHKLPCSTVVQAIAMHHRASPANYDRYFDNQMVDLVQRLTSPVPEHRDICFRTEIPNRLMGQDIRYVRPCRNYEEFTRAINNSSDKEFVVMRVANQALFDAMRGTTSGFVSATFSIGKAASVKTINKRPGHDRAHFDECFYIAPKTKHNEMVVEHFTYLLLATTLLEGKPVTMSTKVAPWVSRYIAVLAPDLLVN